jgi:hypothetical protein
VSFAGGLNRPVERVSSAQHRYHIRADVKQTMRLFTQVL